MKLTTTTGRARDVEPSRPGLRYPPRLVGVVWALLVVNILGSSGQGSTIIPIPKHAAQVVTMGALGLAFVLALLLNTRLRIRPNGFLLLLALLAVESTVSSVFLESGVGALFRCARLAVLVVTLWLLTPWWTDTLAFVRYHIRTISVLLASVVIGLIVAPGLAMPQNYGGRLVGAVWYLPPTQVGDYGAVAAGLTLVLWLTRRASGRTALWITVPAIGLLLASHTRTALIGLAVGLAVVGITLVLTNSRTRKVVTGGILGAGLLLPSLGPTVLTWLRRGQGQQALSNLTGRREVWDALLAEPRTLHEQIFGVGMTDESFHGLPIDNSWLAVFHDQGLIGVAIVAAYMLGLVIAVVTRPPSPSRACALFLVVYCLVASYTQVGIGAPSSYLLHLTVAAALLTGGGSPATASAGSVPAGSGGVRSARLPRAPDM